MINECDTEHRSGAFQPMMHQHGAIANPSPQAARHTY